LSNEFRYDVAFSFLQQDEPLAMQLNDRLQDRVKTFIYTEQQKIVAGTDGEITFHRVFGKEARKVAVLYRTGWGESRWTRIEQTAIRNRGHEHGYTFTVFIPLDKSPKVPNWLPAAQVWVDYNRFGLDGAAAVIEARIQDAGGQVHQETLEEHAQRTERAIAFSQRREKFQWDEGVQAARREYGKLAPALQSCVETIKKSSSIPLAVEQVYNATSESSGNNRLQTTSVMRALMSSCLATSQLARASFSLRNRIRYARFASNLIYYRQG